VRAELGRDATGLDEADAHVPLGDFLAQGLGESVHAELGEAVDAVAVPGDAAGDRADVDDVGDPSPALLGGLQQVGEGGAGGVEQALDVEGDHAVPLLGVRVGDGAQQHQAGIVDQGVQPSESLDGLLYGRLGLGAVGDVRFHGQRGASRLVDLGGEGLQAVPAAGHERDAGTVPGEPAGGGGTDTAARAGDEGGCAGQCRFHGCCPFLADVRRRGRRRRASRQVLHASQGRQAAVRLLVDRAR
jgi:hypothetical protein